MTWIKKDVQRNHWSLLYLTAKRTNIVLSVGACSTFQATPKESHLTVSKLIFRYLKGTHGMVLFYPSGDSLNLIAYADAYYAGFFVDRKRKSGITHFLGSSLILGELRSKIQWRL